MTRSFLRLLTILLPGMAYEMLGKEIETEDFSGLAGGIYLLKVTGDGVVTVRVRKV